MSAGLAFMQVHIPVELILKWICPSICIYETTQEPVTWDIILRNSTTIYLHITIFFLHLMHKLLNIYHFKRCSGNIKMKWFLLCPVCFSHRVPVCFCRINTLKKCVMNMGIGLHNTFQNKIMEVEKIRQFERELRSCLLQHTFHSVDEYMSC
jgi:hypothetical protein